MNSDPPPPPADGPPPRPLQFEIDEDLDGVRLALSEAERPVPRAPTAGSPPPTDATVLSPGDVEALFLGLPDLPQMASDEVAFAKRADSAPPPRTGATVAVSFPPEAGAAAPDVATGPLTLLRYAPEGEVSLAPHLSVTFSQPMVALTSQDRAALVRPVQITPEPAGQWRWVGTKTLLFEPDPRFPMATEYTVSLSDETVSATGERIDGATQWTFGTPPPKVVDAYPQGGPHGLTPTIVVAFDQQMPDDLAEHIVLRGGGVDAVPLVAVTDPEALDEPWIAQVRDSYEIGRYAIVRPTAPLRPATSYTIVVPEGTPSAEGPRTTTSSASFSFFTYDALALDYTSCDVDTTRCTPSGQPYLGFNNPIDADSFDPAWVTVTPELEGLRVRAMGNGLSVSGDLKAHTTYTVSVRDLVDGFGQRLRAPLQARFVVGPADKQLLGPPQDLVILDPAGPPALSVFSVNLKQIKVRAFAVTPDDFAAVSAWMRDARYDNYLSGQPPVKRLASTRVDVTDFVDDELVETAIDLTPWLGDGGLGHVLLWIEPPTQPADRWMRTDHFAWVQRTAIGMTAVVDNDEIRGWTTSLLTAEPLADTTLQLLGETAQVRTDADGLATLAKYPGTEGPHVLVARRGDDVAMLPQTTAWWNQWGGWTSTPSTDHLSWFVFDDRTLYKPGETVSMKGWMRRFDGAAGGGIDGVAGLPEHLAWSAHDSRGNPLGEGKTEVSGTGGFSLEIDLPATPNLGTASVTLRALDGELAHSAHGHSFRIQEFRRPEFEVSTEVDPGPYVLGEHAVVSVRAGYYAGGPLPSAPVQWQTIATPATYSPPGLSDYRFGPYAPWWGWGGMWGRHGAGGSAGQRDALQGETDAAGAHRLQIDFLAVQPPRPYSVRAEATVIDVNRQRWTSAETVLMHPARHYVGLKTDRGFYEADDPIEIALIVADLDGALVADRSVDLSIARLDWVRKDGRWQYVEEDPQETTLQIGGDAHTHTYTPSEGGSYRIRARTLDPEGRPNETVHEVWVSGGNYKQAPSRQVTMEQVTLIPDRDRWQPGDTAQILVQSPFAPASGLLTVARNGILETRPFEMQTTSMTLDLPITDRAVPSLEVSVELVGTAPRRDDEGDPLPDKPERVAVARGGLTLSVPPLAQTLSVSIAPRDDAIDPGGQTTLDVEVRDASGAPVVGEIAVVVVDEAVLALADRVTPDPLAAFYGGVGGHTAHYHNRTLVLLADPETAGDAPLADADVDIPEGTIGLGGRGSGFGGGGLVGGLLDAEDSEMEMDKAGNAGPMSRPVGGEAKRERRSRSSSNRQQKPQTVASGNALREDFSAQALFVPHVVLAADGTATVPLTLPDSLTRYRILVVAVSGDRFGVDESAITARRPVMIRPSPPRFLNFGDRAELPLVVQNQTQDPVTVDLGLRMSNAQIIDDIAIAPSGDAVRVAGRRLEIPAGDRREIRVPIAAQHAGRARFQAVVRSGSHTDAAQFDFPVWTPATSEAFATYGEIDAGALVQPVEAPADVWPQFGGLEITTSSTALQALTDALLYLAQYPYDCTEQMASRVMAVAALRDVLDAFEAEALPSPEDLEAAVVADLERIRKRQHANGGFGFWPRLAPEPYLTVHVTHALVRAQDKGLSTDDRALDQARPYLRRIEDHIPRWYGPDSRRSIRAYALYVLHLAGENDVAKARKLLGETSLERLSLEAQGWLAPVLLSGGRSSDVDRLIRHWENRVTETAAAAQFDVGYGDDADYVMLHSSRRTDGILLDSLIRVRPDHDVIPKLVRGLLGHRVAGRWSTTQENSFVLLALDAYFRRYEATTPDFVARVWLGDQYAGDHAFRGRTTERANIDVPMAWLTDPGDLQDLILAKEGEGRLYYRIGLDYAPKDLSLDPADRGFSLERRYESLGDPADVTRDPDGTWRVRAGAEVRVRVTMVSEARRTHVALVDPLPGGFEAKNPELATTGSVPQDPEARTSNRYWWWRSTWYEHQNLRDERVEAFTALLWSGVFEYTYVATATTPGHFVVPPAKAEEMYHPETFGRTGTDRMIIE